VLEKKGLHQEEDILENNGIDSETDVSVLDQDDFSKLVSRGFKPLDVKKLERWCDTCVHDCVCTCREHAVTKEVDMSVTTLLNLTFQKQRWSKHTMTPLFLLLCITGNRQSKERKELSWSE
jgi:hypothetical protein